MNFIIDKFAILSPLDKKAFDVEYSRKTNLIVGAKDSGKSTLARAMMYTLGCDVKNFELKEKLPNNIYILSFRIESDKYVLLRKRLKSGKGKNYFKIYKNNQFEGVFYNTKDFAGYLNKIMNISVVTLDNQYKETLLYPNHIFLPFFTDQDNSWQNYLSSTFSNLGFIKQYKKLVLEYFIGTRSNEYYELRLQQSKLHNQIEKKIALIESKELIFEENSRNIKIVENIDINDFKEQYSLMLGIYEKIINAEHELKKKINKKMYLRNSYLEAREQLSSNIDDFMSMEIDKECPNCHQEIEKDFKEDYHLYSTRENLINERELIEMHLKESEEELDTEMELLKNLKQENVHLKNTLNSDGKIVDLAERADSYALSRINTTLEQDIRGLKSDLTELQEDKKTVDNKLRKMKDKDLSTKYKELMRLYFDVLSIPFNYKSFYDTNFESVKISLSGTTKVQAFITQYLTVYKLIQENKSVIKIPMIIDSYIKDHFNERDTELTTKFIFGMLDQISHQSFVFITDSKQTIDSIELDKVNIIKLSGVSNLLNNEYEEIYSRYSQYIQGELD
ncbi:ATP-binding protein [Bacillus toyonensis]|uniref:ATP-binding protein n=1 Tax=Bacillus toyonensis TaxID=155322 RepID=UPI003D1DA2BB